MEPDGIMAAIEIRLLTATDISSIHAGFEDSGWERSPMLMEEYLAEQERGERVVIVAYSAGYFAGFATVRWSSEYPLFAERLIPEIADLIVLPPFQRQGIASRIVDEAERRIFERSEWAGIAVGLYGGYGAAQRMYIQRGYVPDGLGLFYKGRYVRPYREIRVDDDLVLHLVKEKNENHAPATPVEGQAAEWFDSLKHTLESAYLQQSEPWRQSGLMISDKAAWTACRKPIADCVDKSGSFLDIGCANGYLLETVLGWTKERGLTVIPSGLDLSEKLIDLAKARLPRYKGNLRVGNAMYWKALNPPRFDYVHSEIVYVPESLQRRYVERLIDSYLKADGRLLLTEYRSRKDPPDKPWIDTTLADWDIRVERSVSGFYDGNEVTRVFVIAKPSFVP
jgi:GNAT superfamily N-acetyltransferase/SAM-dependent methyltransferase